MFQTLAFCTTVLHRNFTAYTTRRLQALGLHLGALFPLLYVDKHPDCTQAQLTAALGLDWGHSQRTVARLVEGGFLIRTKSGRAYRLALSGKGEEAVQVGHQVFFDWDREILGALDDGEREQLFSLLTKAIQKEANHTQCTNS